VLSDQSIGRSVVWVHVMLVYASLEMLALPFSSFLVMSSILQHDLGWLSCSNYHAPPPFNLLFF
jgi:hypothetical protein